MRLLLDQNLSHRLVRALSEEYPGSTHVREAVLSRAGDEAIWEYARGAGLTIVSKDSDFHQRSLLEGPPPKVVWIQRGNCSTQTIAELLRQRRADLETFELDLEAAFLILE